MDTIVYPTDTDLLRALIPLVPAATIQATLAELGLGSVPHNRLLDDAVVSILEAIPVLRSRLLGQVCLTLDQVATVLRISPSTLRQLVQTEVVPISSSGKHCSGPASGRGGRAPQASTGHSTASGRVV